MPRPSSPPAPGAWASVRPWSTPGWCPSGASTSSPSAPVPSSGSPPGRAGRLESRRWRLRRELADARRPVAKGRTRAGGAGARGAGAQLVVARGGPEEATTPRGVIARVGDVLTGDPDRVAVHRGGAVVAPARAGWISTYLRLVAGQAIVRGSSLAARDDRPRAGSGDGVDRRVGRAREERIARRRECHHSSTARGDADRRIRKVVASRAEVALQRHFAGGRVDHEPLDARAVDRGRVAEERVEIDRVIHVVGKPLTMFVAVLSAR